MGRMVVTSSRRSQSGANAVSQGDCGGDCLNSLPVVGIYKSACGIVCRGKKMMILESEMEDLALKEGFRPHGFWAGLLSLPRRQNPSAFSFFLRRVNSFKV